VEKRNNLERFAGVGGKVSPEGKGKAVCLSICEKEEGEILASRERKEREKKNGRENFSRKRRKAIGSKVNNFPDGKVVSNTSKKRLTNRGGRDKNYRGKGKEKGVRKDYGRS